MHRSAHTALVPQSPLMEDTGDEVEPAAVEHGRRRGALLAGRVLKTIDAPRSGVCASDVNPDLQHPVGSPDRLCAGLAA